VKWNATTIWNAPVSYSVLLMDFAKSGLPPLSQFL